MKNGYLHALHELHGEKEFSAGRVGTLFVPTVGGYGGHRCAFATIQRSTIIDNVNFD